MSQMSEEQRKAIIEKLNQSRKDRDTMILNGIRAKLPEAKELLKEMNSHWGGEDGVYRFYHHSFKVYYLNDYTRKAVALFKEMVPTLELNELFKKITDEATSKTFTFVDNENWLSTRSVPEAFFHCKYFLELMVRYGEKLEEAPNMLPSGWAAILYLWNAR